MGAFRRPYIKGARKKVANFVRFVVQTAKNGQFPPEPKDDKERELYENLGVVFLENDEMEIVLLFFKILSANENGWSLNLELLKAYCLREELDFLEIYEIFTPALNALNKEYFKKTEK